LRATRESRARDFALRLAGVNHSRRIYGMKGTMWERALATLAAEVALLFEEMAQPEITVGLLADGLAVLGVPISDPPSSVLRFMGELRERDVEIISFKPGTSVAELETLISYLASDAADVAAVKADNWLAERGVLHIGIKHLKLMRGGLETFRDVYWRGRRILGREFVRARQQGALNGGAVGELARSLMEVILAGDAPIATLLALQDRDDFAMVHSVNVATLAGTQAGALGLPEEEVQGIVVAGLMHDIGKTRVPEAILAKAGKLLPKEKELLDRHPIEGARLLMESQGASQLAAVVALEHHRVMRVDDVGLAATELVKLADVFDTIRSLRPFDDPRSMRGAVSYMVRHLFDRFNPYFLERFGRLVGLCPEGDHAWLSTSEIVRVVETDPELALHPVVEVLDQREGSLPRGEKLDLAKHADDATAPRLVPLVPATFADLDPAEIDALG
jgi:HD-GYP domain-containing protein (c-di-GMP phosphodiesterase class II)